LVSRSATQESQISAEDESAPRPCTRLGIGAHDGKEYGHQPERQVIPCVIANFYMPQCTHRAFGSSSVPIVARLTMLRRECHQSMGEFHYNPMKLHSNVVII
jgi:hypothetical protein